MDLASNLPWWDDPRMASGVGDRLRRQCRKAKGWPAEAGPSPTSGERTVLHDHIARTPGLLTTLEREFGIDFPSSLRDEADLAEAAQPVKRCGQCWQCRPAGNFLSSPLTADGLTDRCKPCVFANAARDRLKREQRRRETALAIRRAKRALARPTR